MKNKSRIAAVLSVAGFIALVSYSEGKDTSHVPTTRSLASDTGSTVTKVDSSKLSAKPGIDSAVTILSVGQNDTVRISETKIIIVNKESDGAVPWNDIASTTIAVVALAFAWWQGWSDKERTIRETRAYIEPYLECPKLNEANGDFTLPLSISLKNIGATPAKDITFNFEFFVEDGPTKQRNHIASPIITAAFTLSSNESRLISQTLNIEASVAAKAVEGSPEKRILIAGYVQYFDVFKIKRMREWTWELWEFDEVACTFQPIRLSEFDKET